MMPPVTRPERLLRWAAVGALVMVTGTVVRSQPSGAVGPVIAVTPYEVVDDGFVGWVFNPQVSGRGEAVTFIDQEVVETGFVFMDNATPEAMVDGEGIAVSGNGCVAAWVRRNNSTQLGDGRSIGITDRCAGVEREVTRTNVNYDNNAQMALSFDGRFAAVELPPSIGSEFESSHIVRIDTVTGNVIEIPFPDGAIGPAASLGLDISDDGNTIVATFVFPGPPNIAQVSNVPVSLLWDIPSNAINGLATGSVFASLSGDARYVALTSSTRLTGTETGSGPWVYVHDRATGGFVRASSANGTAYYSSISGDGSQVAFGVGPASCSYTLLNESQLNSSCPINRIDVAYGPASGLTAGVNFDTISLDVNGRAAGVHLQPNLSWSGRWVTWVSGAGNALIGSTDPELGRRHAFLRERDGAIAVTPLNFGSLLAGTSSTALSTVQNTGRTSVFLDQIQATGGAFTTIAGGSCTHGAVLAPGATCTVNVRFAAPAAPGDQAGTLTVGETGFRPVVASAPLSGRSSATPPPVTTTSTTTTTRPPPTTTTIPGVITLTALPNPIDFGQVAVGIGSAIQTITVTNVGNVPAQIVTSMGGPNPDDFFVSQNLCNAILLAPGASCSIDVIIVALAGGNRTATLSITVPNVGGEDVVLFGQGRFSPRLIASPSAITERGFTTIIGQGFPPGGTFDVHVGDTGPVVSAVADGTGVFRIPITALGTLTLGDYVLRIDAVPDVFEIVLSLLVVSLPTFQPQSPGGAVFGDSILVTRGG